MIKTIEKKCEIGRDYISLRFTDTRDNYIYKTALGDIGEITISQDYIFIMENNNDDDNLARKRKEVLQEAFQDIFGKDKADCLPNEYYQSIKSMISTGVLGTLGYQITTFGEELDFEDVNLNNNDTGNKRR